MSSSVEWGPDTIQLGGARASEPCVVPRGCPHTRLGVPSPAHLSGGPWRASQAEAGRWKTDRKTRQLYKHPQAALM